jgi:hypothetical protein
VKNLIQAAVVTLCAASTAQAQQAVQWQGNGHWYSVSGGQMGQISAQEARAAAAAAGAHLITVTSEAEAAFITQSMFWQFNQANIWLGAQRDANGAWAWDTGESWSYSNFAPSFCNFGSSAIRMGDAGGGCGTGNSPIAPWAMWPDNYPVYVRLGLEWDSDCNGDGIVDYGQVRDGSLPDQNHNSIPDGCECSAHPELEACCYGDLNADRRTDGSDLGILLAFWGAVSTFPKADINHDGQVDGADLGMLLANWGACPN